MKYLSNSIYIKFGLQLIPYFNYMMNYSLTVLAIVLVL